MPELTIDMRMLGKPKQRYWSTYILQRIKKNKNFLCFISGQTGSGKSWSTLSLCEELDKDFNINQVVFNGLELMNLINSGTLKRGSCINFEEVGVEMSNKNWQSTTNKVIAYLVQTFRYRGYILFMNSPYMDFLDAGIRKLFHCEMSTNSINFNTGICTVKPRTIQYNSRTKKFYYKMLRVITSEGIVPIDAMKIGKPSPQLIGLYEKKKNIFSEDLNKLIHQELLSVQEKKKAKFAGPKLTDNQEEIYDRLNEGKTVEEVAKEREVSKHTIYETVYAIKRKGFEVKTNGIPQN